MWRRMEPTEESVDKIAAAILKAQGNSIDALRQGIQLPPLPQAPRPSRTTSQSGVPIISELAERYLRDRRNDLTPKSFISERYGHGGALRGLARAVGRVRFKGFKLPG